VTAAEISGAYPALLAKGRFGGSNVFQRPVDTYTTTMRTTAKIKPPRIARSMSESGTQSILFRHVLKV
jgi:hypothetical protein